MEDHVSAATPAPDAPEKLDFEIVKLLGPAPCPTEDCDGTGSQVELPSEGGRVVIDVICEKCQRESDERDEQRQHEERVEDLMRRSGRTPLLETWSLESYASAFPDEPGRLALDMAGRWIESYLNRSRERACPSLLIFGPVGGGKTGIAWGIVRRLIECEIEARFVNFPELLDNMRESFAHQRPTYEAMNAGSISVLAVDDVGAERATPWAVEQLLLLVDRRRQRLLPTIFTSNYEPDELADRLGAQEQVTGERIVSRMIQGSIQHRIEAPDRRLTV